MYIEMIDETGQVSEKLKEQTLELLDFAAQRLGKEDKEMAVTFVTNERSHELNLEYRDTDRPTDVISLEYKPELDISFDEEELAENPELAEMMGEFDSYIGELFISVAGWKTISKAIAIIVTHKLCFAVHAKRSSRIGPWKSRTYSRGYPHDLRR